MNAQDPTLCSAEEFVTIGTLARELGRCTNTVRNALADGRIRADAVAVTLPGRSPIALFRRSHIPRLSDEIIARN